MPAARAVDLGGWLLRATPDVRARRANSVLALDDDPSVDLDQRIVEVQRFYAACGQPARFQLTPASRPAELEAVLRDRGYVCKSPTLVCVGDAAALPAGNPDDLRVTLQAAATAAWWATWCTALDIDPTRQAGPAALWRRIEPESAFALALVDGRRAGVGMAVRDGRWVGIFNMATLPQARRRGVARGLLGALADWGHAGGAERVYLQVDAGNGPARAVYARAGLTELYEYAYLVR